jgi:opacity protein-like surface antigen
MKHVSDLSRAVGLCLVLHASKAISHTVVVGEDSGRRVAVIDASDPDLPAVVATVDTNLLIGVQAVAIDQQGTRVVAVGKQTCAVQIIDISTPSAPAKDTALSCTNSLFSGISSVAVTGARAVIAQQAGNGIQVLDVSGSTPSLIGSVLRLPFFVGAVAANGPFAYVTAASGGRVAVVDISGANPVLVGSPASSPYGGLSSVAASGFGAVIGQASGPGIQTITSMQTLGANLPTGLDGVTSVALVSTSAGGARALAGEDNGGRVVVADVTNASAPQVVKTLQPGFSGISSVAAVVGMGWIGAVAQKSGPGVRIIKDLKSAVPSLGGTVSPSLNGTSSIAMTIAPPDPSAGHGDPHLRTVNGIHYDFQGAGEFVYMRSDDIEVQARQTAISTEVALLDSYSGLSTCVSLNTGVAVRTGGQRITFQPAVVGVSDPSRMQLLINGQLTTLGSSGLDLPGGGRVSPTSARGIRVDSPGDTTLLVTPGWWDAQRKWYLNIDVLHAPRAEGLLGPVPPGSWLPNVPGGVSVGPIPAALDRRYADLYQRFGNAWRVTEATSLFDYAQGTGPATFTLANWPPASGPCRLQEAQPAKATTVAVAQRACSVVKGEPSRKNCVFDVSATGNLGFAETYAKTEQVIAEATGQPYVLVQPSSPFAVTLGVGAGVPTGSGSSAYRAGFSVDVLGEFALQPQISATGRAGYVRLRGRSAPGADIYYLTGGARLYVASGSSGALRPFVSASAGVYDVRPGSTRAGAGVGAGVLYDVAPDVAAQGSYEFHRVSTRVATKFSTLHVGVRFQFWPTCTARGLELQGLGLRRTWIRAESPVPPSRPCLATPSKEDNEEADLRVGPPCCGMHNGACRRAGLSVRPRSVSTGVRVARRVRR